MDVPSDIGRYLGCDRVQELQVKLTVHHHPFAHLFDKSLPDPLAKEAAAAERTPRGLRTFGKLMHQKESTSDITVNQERDIMFQTKKLLMHVT